MDYRVDDITKIEEDYCYVDYELNKLNIELFMMHSLARENALTEKCLKSLLNQESYTFDAVKGKDRQRVIDSIENGIKDAVYAKSVFDEKINDIMLRILENTHVRDSLALKMSIK